jgi:hypothetical protein
MDFSNLASRHSQRQNLETLLKMRHPRTPFISRAKVLKFLTELLFDEEEDELMDQKSKPKKPDLDQL